MALTIEERIAQANERLKAASVGITIEQDGKSLYLRGILPPKPGSQKTRPYQQRLALKPLGIRPNPAGIVEAAKEAQKVGALVARKEFDWEPYLYSKATKPTLVSQWTEQYEEYFYSRGGNETSWKGDHWKILKRLPPNEPLCATVLEKVILETEPNTKTRKRACMALKAFADFAKLAYDPSHLAGNYSPKRVSPRDLPDDTAIALWQSKISNPGWRWVYSMIATYGLRPHEVFRLDHQQLCQGSKIVSVLENTKTGSRQVWACYPEWFEQFALWEVELPKISLDRTNEAVGRSCSHYFLDFKLPFRLYDLRHRWAVRTMEFGLDISLAAQQMGHSVQTHSQTYHHWITQDVHQRAFQVLMERPDCPKAPEI